MKTVICLLPAEPEPPHPASDGVDTDEDGRCDVGDNCVDILNPDNCPTSDNEGDVCDDSDLDNVLDADDEAPCLFHSPAEMPITMAVMIARR